MTINLLEAIDAVVDIGAKWYYKSGNLWYYYKDQTSTYCATVDCTSFFDCILDMTPGEFSIPKKHLIAI